MKDNRLLETAGDLTSKSIALTSFMNSQKMCEEFSL